MIRSTASRQFRVLDCSASIEVLACVQTSPISFVARGKGTSPWFPLPYRRSRLLFVFIDTILFQEIYSSFAKKTKFKYSKTCLLQFSRNEVPAKTEINNDEIIFHSTLSIGRFMLHCCKPAFCVIYTMALFSVSGSGRSPATPQRSFSAYVICLTLP